MPPLDELLLVLVPAAAPLGVDKGALPRLPLAPAVEEVAEEEDAVGPQLALQGAVAAAQVVVGDGDGERVQWPGAARVRVRIDDLRIGDEDEVVWFCAFGLYDTVRTLAHARGCLCWTYPFLPMVPMTVCDLAVKHP